MFLGCLSGLRAQDVKEAYERNKRDVQAVSTYVKALRMGRQEKLADSVVREYMGRCPVVQLEDKDTYLLLGRYAFEDVYSNAFDYGLFIAKKLRWDREPKTGADAKEAMFYRLRWGGGADEIDKRYEILTTLSRNLEKEIDRRCCPSVREGRYRMPEYDSLKVAHLKYLLRKGEFLRDGSLRMKVGVYEDYVAGDYAGVVQKLQLVRELNWKELGESYAMQVLDALVLAGANREVLLSGIALLQDYIRGVDEESVHCFSVLGELYRACGDEASGERYKRLGEQAEAAKKERFGSFIDVFKHEE